ncbi:elongation factor G [Chloroflexota bacterium]
MDKYNTDQIRNVALLSHSGAGKTSLSEAMLFNSKVTTRIGKVEDGTTTSDYEPEESKRKSSINLSLVPFGWDKTKINLLDTPGYPDFVGEVMAALRVVEGAVVVVCAASGVEVGTELVWKYAEDKEVPRIIFINKLDRDNADFYKVVGQIEVVLGKKCVAIQLPVGAESSFEGVVDLIATDPSEVPISVSDKMGNFREKLMEAVAETDDELIAKYLEGEELTPEEVRQGLRVGTASGKIVPIMVGSATQNKSVTELMNAISEYLPSPKEKGEVKAQNPVKKQEESLSPETTSPLSALAFKTTADPYMGRLTYLRVYSGVLKSDSNTWNSAKNKAERIGQLYAVRGKAQEPVSDIITGDIGSVAKLAETNTGDTICAQDHPLVLDPTEFPSPVLSMAIHPKTKADTDKLGSTLVRMCEEDRTLSVRRDQDTSETVLSGMGDAHFETVAEKMKRKFGVEVKIELPRIPFKETITVPVKAEYKHKKQTGGHGQYGHVMFNIEPLPKGSGAEFAAKVVGGSVPKNYIPAVEKGVKEAFQEGVLAGYPMTDIKVTLYDGSSHPVDSSEISFKIAASHALRKGVSQGQPVLQEPVMDVQITVPESFTGEVISDLNGKRARVSGMVPEDGASVIEAQAPLAEMLRYATDLRSITQGRGTHTMAFSHYEEVPQHIAQKIITESDKTTEKT